MMNNVELYFDVVRLYLIIHLNKFFDFLRVKKYQVVHQIVSKKLNNRGISVSPHREISEIV